MSSRKGIAYGLAAALFGATYLTINRHVYLAYHPSAFAYSATFLITAGVFALISLTIHRAKQSLNLTKRPSLLLTNGILAGVGMGLLVYGQNYTTAVNASILFSATTIPTVIFSKYMLKDTLTRHQVGWIAVMFIGLYFAVVGAHLLNFNRGDLFILSAVVLIGFTNTYSKIVMKDYDAGVIADSRLVIGGLLFIALGLGISGSNFFTTTAGAWPWLAGLFLWLTIKSFYRAINLMNPSRAIVLVNSHPIITPFLSVILLSEPYNWVKALGSVVLLLSVYQITKR